MTRLNWAYKPPAVCDLFGHRWAPTHVWPYLEKCTSCGEVATEPRPQPKLNEPRQFRMVHRSEHPFAPDAFDKAIGTPVPLTQRGMPVGTGTLVKAEISSDGHSVELTIETDSADVWSVVDPDGGEKPWSLGLGQG